MSKVDDVSVKPLLFLEYGNQYTVAAAWYKGKVPGEQTRVHGPRIRTVTAEHTEHTEKALETEEQRSVTGVAQAS